MSKNTYAYNIKYSCDEWDAESLPKKIIIPESFHIDEITWFDDVSDFIEETTGFFPRDFDLFHYAEKHPKNFIMSLFKKDYHIGKDYQWKLELESQDKNEYSYVYHVLTGFDMGYSLLYDGYDSKSRMKMKRLELSCETDEDGDLVEEPELSVILIDANSEEMWLFGSGKRKIMPHYVHDVVDMINSFDVPNKESEGCE